MTIGELDTPVLICDLDTTERNLRAMQSACNAGGTDLRPHIKTHKTPEIARWQLDLGAVGLCCAKLGEAEVMRDQAGCEDLFIAYPIVGAAKYERLKRLMDRADVRVSIDSEEQARLLSSGLGGAKVKIRFNVDCGLFRDGMTPEAVVESAERIAALPGLEMVGVFTHEGQAHQGRNFQEVLQIGRQAADDLLHCAEELRRRGLSCDEVAPGGTPTAADLAGYPGVTEVRPGTYLFSDAMCMAAMETTPDDCAVRVITTVVDRPGPNRVILDGGSKTFFNDQMPGWGRAYCIEYPALHLEKCTEEHGHGEWTGDGPAPLKVGDRLTWIPSHVCPVVNLFDEMVCVRGDQVETTFNIAARGKLR